MTKISGIPMRAFYCDDFEGYYPIGTCAVVVDTDCHEARKQLVAELQKRGLSGKRADGGDITLHLISTDSREQVIIVCDGNY